MEEEILKRGLVGGKVKYEIYRPGKPLLGKPFTLTSKNIGAVFRRVERLLDTQCVDYPKRFYTQYGTGRMEADGRIIFDAWDNPPKILTKKDF